MKAQFVLFCICTHYILCVFCSLFFSCFNNPRFGFKTAEQSGGRQSEEEQTLKAKSH